MREQEWLDKENGTDYALQGPRMSDSDMNIMRDLAGEADEPCFWCDEPVRPNPNPRGKYFEFSPDEDGEIPAHEECVDEAREEAELQRGLAQMESRYSDQESAFNARWPR